MSLATRCTACGTVFRVVQDQLKVSEGWVRCGRCDRLQRARRLFDSTARGRPGGTKRAVADPAPPTVDPRGSPTPRQPALPPTETCRSTEPPARTSIAATRARRSTRRALADPRRALGPRKRPRRAEAGRQSAPEDRSSSPTPASIPTCLDKHRRREPARCSRRPSLRLPLESAAAGVRPSRRPAAPLASGRCGAARHRARAARRALSRAGGPPQRDRLAARWPSLRPALARAGAASLDCTIEPPRRIETCGRKHRARAPSAPKPTASRSGCATARRAVAMPVDRPEPDRRRRPPVVAPRSRGRRIPRAPPLAAGAERRPAASLLADRGGCVAGYTVEIFYP